MTRVLIAGGTGHLGRHLVPELKRRGYQVRTLSRQPVPSDLDVDEHVRGDLRNPASLASVCDGIDQVISAAGASLALQVQWGAPGYQAVDYAGNLNLLRVAQAAGVRHFTYVSVYHTPAYADTVYVRAHTDFEAALRHSNVAYTIVRPTGYFSAMAALLRFARLGRAPLLGDGSATTNPIHEADLAAVCADALNGASTEIDVGGPEVLSRRTLFEKAFDAVGKHPRFIRVPAALLSLNRRLIAPIDRRLADLLAFSQAVSLSNVVAPPRGTRTIGAYFRDCVASTNETT